jgi:hypothetical protein
MVIQCSRLHATPTGQESWLLAAPCPESRLTGWTHARDGIDAIVGEPGDAPGQWLHGNMALAFIS